MNGSGRLLCTLAGPVAALALTAAGCAVHDAVGRLYRMDTGDVLHATFERFGGGHGRVTAVAPDGERLAGEFMLWSPEEPIGAKRKWALPSGVARPPVPWPEQYGFGQTGRQSPTGTAVLVGDRGTVIEVVLYQANWYTGDGDGVARDNRGRLYRIYIGDDESSDPGP